MAKEIEIPDGCEAKIVGNKVVFVPKESEDEKIMKAIGYAIANATHANNTLIYGVTQDEAYSWLEKQKEQKPEESDAIKGGDFISDGKRVFLVLANVKERNLGETFSTFCEGLILGVDGVVYCNGDDFKKFKRATSDERAKFIHDLKVGVKLKERPTEWDYSYGKNETVDNLIGIAECLEMDADCSFNGMNGLDCGKFLRKLAMKESIKPAEWNEEDEMMLKNIISDYEAASKSFCGHQGKLDWLKSLRPQPH